MAATNFTPIQLYFSTTASAVPLAANLAQGELAINITDGKLYYEDNAGVVQVIATKGAGTIGGSTTQIQYNNAGALAGNAAMTFNSGTSTTTLTTLNLTNALGATFGGTAQSSYTQGDILYSSATNTLSKLGIGAVNYILTSSGSVPQWAAPSSITVNTATNLAGGAAGSVPYQSGVATTTFLAIGAADRIMTSSGTAPQWVTSLTGLTGVSSSSITNTSLTSGRVVVSTTAGLQADDPDLTFDGTTLSAGGFSTTGLSTLVKTVKIGDSNFSGTAVFAAATPAKLYIGTGTVTDTTSAIGATNSVGAISSLAITPIAATNTSVTYTNAATLYIAGAPSAGTNVTLTNPYALYVAAGNAYFGGTVTAGTVNLTTLDLTNLEVTNIKAKDGTAAMSIADTTGIVSFTANPILSGGTANGVLYLNGSKSATSGTALVFDGTNFGVGVTPSTWFSTRRALQIGQGASVSASTNSSVAEFSSNVYIDAAGSNIYVATGTASRYQQSTGAHTWSTAASGTAGAAATLTQAMTLEAAGTLLVGMTTDTGIGVALFPSGITRKNTNGTVFDQYRYGGTSVGTTTTDGANIQYNAASSLVFGTNGTTEAMRITSTQLVGIGNTSPPTGVRVTSKAPSASGYNYFLEQNNGLDGYLLACTSNDGDLVFSRRDTSGTVTTERARLSSAGFLLVGTATNTNSYYAVVLNDIAIRTNTDASGSTNLRLGVSSSMPQGIATLNGTKTAVGGGDMIFNTATGGVLAERMRLTGAGYFGINTTSPNFYAHISTGLTTSITQPTAGSYGLYIQQNTSGSTGGIYIQDGATNSGSSLVIADNNGAVRFNVDTDGNVIIGTGNENGQFTVRNASANKATGGFLATNTSGPNFCIDAVSYATAANTTALMRGFSGTGTPSIVFNLNGSGNISQFGGQITFPATQSASANANTLDDYEEGTFTANLSNAGYTGSWGTTLARYVKIGKVVNCWVSFDGGTSGAGTGNLTISGLPFAPENFTNWWCIGSWNGSGTTYPQGSVIANGTSTTVAVWNGGGYVTEVKTFLTACISYTTST